MAYESALNKFLDNLPNVVMEMRRQNIQQEQADKRLAFEEQERGDLQQYRDDQLQQQEDVLEFNKKNVLYERQKDADNALFEGVEEMSPEKALIFLGATEPQTEGGRNKKSQLTSRIQGKIDKKKINLRDYRTELEAIGILAPVEIDRAVGTWSRSGEERANQYVKNVMETKYNVSEWTDKKNAQYGILKIEYESALERYNNALGGEAKAATFKEVETARANMRNFFLPPKEKRTRVGTFKIGELNNVTLMIGDTVIDANGNKNVVTGFDADGMAEFGGNKNDDEDSNKDKGKAETEDSNLGELIKMHEFLYGKSINSGEDKKTTPELPRQVIMALGERRKLAKHGRTSFKHKWVEALAKEIGLKDAGQLDSDEGIEAWKTYFSAPNAPHWMKLVRKLKKNL